ncbi:hypothetical protein cyc_00982 [Cyclospora cayetanensis]|uniref:Uncharacterized protein n=1 Tax=Cyclospora cayetanensis TaxID=88456 RepID=A0A1D3D985_9EIME|nr:hypothetical protein cyc_00982 [Cyclospora cayetanensis]
MLFCVLSWQAHFYAPGLDVEGLWFGIKGFVTNGVVVPVDVAAPQIGGPLALGSSLRRALRARVRMHAEEDDSLRSAAAATPRGEGVVQPLEESEETASGEQADTEREHRHNL